MHPDAEAVYSPTWDVHAPTVSHSGRVGLTILAKKMSTEPTPEDEAEADALAAKLIHDPQIYKSGRTTFNKVAFRMYTGSGITELAERRG